MIIKPYLKAFESKKTTVTMYENFAGFYIDEANEPELVRKIKEVEEKYNGTVYSVTPPEQGDLTKD